jgi:DNA repair exonuclease SbcCD ATPase subunit
VTPTESREVVLTLSRERLARASSRLERAARDASERILHLKDEKRALEQRLKDLEHLFAQERQNFDQRASLLESLKSENEERAKTFTELQSQLQDSERLLNEQHVKVSLLEVELAERGVVLQNQQAMDQTWQAELNEWKEKTTQLEQRLGNVTSERDTLRANVYDNERRNAQFVLHFTQEDRESAAHAIEVLLNQVASLEEKALASEEK